MTLAREVWRVVRFMLVGAIATIVYLLASVAVIAWFNVNPTIGATIGFCTSFAVSYVGHFHLTFGVIGRYRDYIARFCIISLCSFLISTTLVWCATTLLQFNYRIALILVAVIIPIYSYAMNRFWVFVHPVNLSSSSPPLKPI